MDMCFSFDNKWESIHLTAIHPTFFFFKVICFNAFKIIFEEMLTWVVYLSDAMCLRTTERDQRRSLATLYVNESH